ncbi:MAG: DUF5674 family protein [Candidatus Margulisiibacteriota bacterium]|nr:DUF5674 family protein [Candidatus Margulisiibacteriota bacterium]
MEWPKISHKPLSENKIKGLAEEFFGDMIKVVVDIEEGILAAGCSSHADAEQILLKKGLKQKNVWGANYSPFRKKGERLEYTALMNIRPRQNNPSQSIQSPEIR